METTKKQTALITGASAGIGRAIALSEAKKGRNLVLNYSGNAAGAEETADLIRESCPETEILIYRADVSREEEVSAMTEAAVERFGSLEILVNNAGITRDGLLLRMTAEDFDAVLQTNLRSCFLLCREAGKRMFRQRYGRIVNISSVVGIHGNAGQVNYAASKAGIIGLTKSMAQEYAGRRITVNAVAPGFIETRMTAALPEKVREAMLSRIPAGAFGNPEDVARTVSFLTDEAAGYITGQVLTVDGGLFM